MDEAYEKCWKEKTSGQLTTSLTLAEMAAAWPLKSNQWAKPLQTLLALFWQGHI